MSDLGETGGPAFPEGDAVFGGMSLRDWFAGMALAGWMAHFGKNAKHPARNLSGIDYPCADANEIAGASYEIADAMLKERSRAE